MAQGLGSRGLKARGFRFLGLQAYNIGLIVMASGFRELGFCGGVFYPRGACTQMVYTLALKYSLYRYIGPKVCTCWVHGPLGLYYVPKP